MSSHPYVTPAKYPAGGSTPLMSTTDLQSYITHANDTFVQVRRLIPVGVTGATTNTVRHPDMPKRRLRITWFTLKRGTTERHQENRRKMATIIVRANAVPMVREEKNHGYMSIRTRATDEDRGSGAAVQSAERRTYR